MKAVEKGCYFDPEIKWETLKELEKEDIIDYWKQRKRYIRNRPVPFANFQKDAPLIVQEPFLISHETFILGVSPESFMKYIGLPATGTTSRFQ